MIFRQRYLHDDAVISGLVTLVRHNLPAESMNRVLYFYSTRSDLLLHDLVTEFLSLQYDNGRRLVTVHEVESWIREQIEQGKTKSEWSPKTITRSAQELLSTLRDFGVLQGAKTKYISPPYLPISSFAYIAFNIWVKQGSGSTLLEHQDWRLFFLSAQIIERLFIEAHQHHLLYYQAAGSVTRVDFPVDTLEEYALVISKRTY